MKIVLGEERGRGRELLDELPVYQYQCMCCNVWRTMVPGGLRRCFFPAIGPQAREAEEGREGKDIPS